MSSASEEYIEIPRKVYVNNNQRIIPYVNEGKQTVVASIVGVGDDGYNQLLGQSPGDVIAPQLEKMTVLDLVCGDNFNLVNESNSNPKYNRVWTWGKEVERSTYYFDEDMIKKKETRPVPCPVGREDDPTELHAIPELYKKQVVQVTAGQTHAAALTQEGDVFTWGIYRQDDIELGMRPTDVDLQNPMPVVEPEIVEEVILDQRIVQIASAANVTYALAENGDVYHWGGNRASSHFTNRTVQTSLTPITVRFPSSKVCAIFANGNSDNVFAVTRRGKVYGWGPNDCFQVGHEKAKPFTKAERAKIAAANKKKSVGEKKHFGPHHTEYYYIPKECNAIHEVLDIMPSEDVSDEKIAIGYVSSISSGKKHGALVTTDGEVYCWGSNEFGQCGGADNDYVVPNKVKVPGKAIEVACGSNFTIVLTDESKVYGWGLGTNGRLGPNGKKKTTKPVLVSEGLGDVEIIAAGKKHCLFAVSN